jgi:hypothetical protein
VAAGLPASTRAEVRVDANTEIGAVRFVFTDSSTLDERDLRQELVFTVKHRPSALARTFAFLPGISGQTRYALLPLEIAQGAARVAGTAGSKGSPAPRCATR